MPIDNTEGTSAWSEPHNQASPAHERGTKSKYTYLFFIPDNQVGGAFPQGFVFNSLCGVLDRGILESLGTGTHLISARSRAQSTTCLAKRERWEEEWWTFPTSGKLASYVSIKAV